MIVPYINNVIFAGRLIRDAEFNITIGLKKYAKLIVINSKRKKNGENWEDVETVIVSVTWWNDYLDSVKDKLLKGAGVLIEGKLSYESWTDVDGNKKNKLRIVANKVNIIGDVASKDKERDYQLDKENNQIEK